MENEQGGHQPVFYIREIPTGIFPKSFKKHVFILIDKTQLADFRIVKPVIVNGSEIRMGF
jgi:hypothetical protein